LHPRPEPGAAARDRAPPHAAAHSRAHSTQPRTARAGAAQPRARAAAPGREPAWFRGGSLCWPEKGRKIKFWVVLQGKTKALDLKNWFQTPNFRG